jgi:hypothetical protein
MALCDRLLPDGWVCGAYGSDGYVYVGFIKPLNGKYLLERLVPIRGSELLELGVDLFMFDDKDAEKLVDCARDRIRRIDAVEIG